MLFSSQHHPAMNKNKRSPPTSHLHEPSLVTELRQLASLDHQKDPLSNGIDGGSSSGTIPPPEDPLGSSTEYTSLQDIITGETSPQHSSTCNYVSALQTSPKSCCWGEMDVAISNPLVKQAAIAYLHPKLTPPDIDHRGWTERFKEYVCGGCGVGGPLGCLGFVGGLFAGVMGWIFGDDSKREVEQRRDHQD